MNCLRCQAEIAEDEDHACCWLPMPNGLSVGFLHIKCSEEMEAEGMAANITDDLQVDIDS